MGDSSKTVSLVLGSGGARGLAHIGVIRALEETNHSIQSIAGCSMGALVGGIYAAGKLDEYEQWIRNITKMDMVALLDMAWSGGGLVKGDKIIGTLVDLVGNTKIEELPIPFTAVAADLTREREVWLNRGPIFDAIRASMSLPLFFTPVSYKGLHLVDGGVLNPVPIAPTFNDKTDLTIAVNLGGRGGEEVRRKTPEKKAADDDRLHKKIARFIKDLATPDQDEPSGKLGAYAVAAQAFDAMQNTVARQKLAAYPPDVLIEISRNACGSFDYDMAEEMIEHGRQVALKRIGQFKG